MIPKIIHYCWFGNNPLPETAKKCISSWEKYCPDYKIIQWNERNFKLSDCPQYVKDAYNEKKYAFATDYIRLKVVYEHGGIYFDTDVELIKKIDNLLKYNAFFGFENGKQVSTGLGFGAQKGHYILKEMMDDYYNKSFILPDGSLNQETCPMINTCILLQHGLKQNDRKQTLDNNILILPSIYMCPISFETGHMRKSYKTISIHWFDASWFSAADADYHRRHREALQKQKIDFWKHLPNRFLKNILGENNYNFLKRKIKK